MTATYLEAGVRNDPGHGLQQWIDRAVHDATPLEIAKKLTEASLPGPSSIIGPAINGSEGWYWPWNRVGFYYVKNGRSSDGALIFTCAYLAAVAIQQHLRERFHKGMPLCNVAYAWNVGRNPAKARVAAALGVIEDAVTNGDPKGGASYTNLLSAGFGQPRAEALASYSLLSLRGRGRTPLYPEAALAAFTSGPGASLDIPDKMDRLAASVSPASLETASAEIEAVWRRLDEELAAAS